MTPIEVTVSIPAPPEEVWAELERIEHHPEWMADAVDVAFETDRRRGVGTRIAVRTKIGPFGTTDHIEFSEWDPPRLMVATHRGRFGGFGRFELEPDDGGTRFTWTEKVRFPWYLGGPLGALVARPVLTKVWRGNLRRLSARVSAP